MIKIKVITKKEWYELCQSSVNPNVNNYKIVSNYYFIEIFLKFLCFLSWICLLFLFSFSCKAQTKYIWTIPDYCLKDKSNKKFIKWMKIINSPSTSPIHYQYGSFDYVDEDKNFHPLNGFRVDSFYSTNDGHFKILTIRYETFYNGLYLIVDKKNVFDFRSE